MTTTSTVRAMDDIAAEAVGARHNGQHRGFVLAIKAASLLLLRFSPLFTGLTRI